MSRFLIASLFISFQTAAWAETIPEDKKTEAPKAAQVELPSSYKARIKELMEVTHVVEGQKNIAEQIAQDVSREAKDKEKAKKSAYDYFEKVIGVDAMLPEIAETYAKYFSEQELKDLIAFYKSPIGQKAASKMPEVTREMMTKGRAKMQVKMAEFQKEKSKMKGF